MVQGRVLMQFLIVVLAAWLARQQEAFIEYLKAENRMLKARLGQARPLRLHALKDLDKDARDARRHRGRGRAIADGCGSPP